MQKLDIFNEEFNKLVTDGYISVQKHPKDDLFIYNYTHKCQFDKVWNKWTKMCRGIITDSLGNIKARPFEKFFNFEELDSVPDIEFQVHEKYDGSLGILYWRGETACIATRGSFTSDQALMATGMLHTTYAGLISSFDKSKTYLFEIIYPKNRIVVDYGDDEKLILIAVIDTATGKDDHDAYHASPFEKATSYECDISSLSDLKPNRDNSEGYVIEFKDGLRCKIKHDEYVRLHRLMTGVNERRIWEVLQSDGIEGIKKFIDRVPDEFYEWVHKKTADLLEKYLNIEMCAGKVYDDLLHLSTRKEQAQELRYNSHIIRSVVFAMLDNKPYSHIIWKHIKPAAEKPFKIEV